MNAWKTSLLTLAFALTAGLAAAQQANDEEVARRQYDSGLAFLQNHRDAEALKDLQTVVDSFGTSSLADNALLQIALYHLDVSHDLAATQVAVDRLLKEYAGSDSAPMGYVVAGRLAMAKGRTAADVDAAMASYERVPRLFPGNEAVAAAGFFAGETLRQAKRLDEAADRYRRVRVEYPRSIWAARAAIGSAYCLVQQDKGASALPELQWIRQQFPGTPIATEALNLTTVLYRLYLRAPAQPSYAFSGRTVGGERANFSDVNGLAFHPDGRLVLGHKAGVTTFDAQGTATTIASQSPSSFFIDDKKRIVIARNGTLTAERGESVTINAIKQDGKFRAIENAPAVLISYKGERLVADPDDKDVLRFDPNGKYLGVFTNTPAVRMVFNSLGEIALLDKSTKSIAIVDRDGKAVGKVPARGTGYELDDPVDIAFDAFDQLYVLDRAKASVFVFGAKYRLVGTATVPERAPGAFARGVAFSIDPAGRLFIFDDRAKRIQVYQ
jgi:TolA-binding protein